MRVTFRFFAIALVAAVLAGCGAAPGNSAQGPDFELKIYKVPAAQSKAIASNLDGILAGPEFNVGAKDHASSMRATTPFPGTVMVLAPASVQRSIAAAVAELAKASSAAGAAQNVAGAPGGGAPDHVSLRVQFWVIQARAGAGTAPASLDPLRPALKRLQGSLGPSHFVLADSASMQVAATDRLDPIVGNGSLLTSGGHEFAFHIMATPAGGAMLKLTASTKGFASLLPGLQTMIPELNTTVDLRLGEYAVLAEAPPAGAPTKEPDAALLNLLVVRVDRVAAPSP